VELVVSKRNDRVATDSVLPGYSHAPDFVRLEIRDCTICSINNFTNNGDVMTDLERFLKWCESLGHYHAVSAVERYLAMLKSIENPR
jgi:hypothetical protein